MTTNTAHTHLRIKVLTIIGIGMLGLLTARLADLQIFRHAKFERVAEAQRKQASDLRPKRGGIYMQEGKDGGLFPVASNSEDWTMYAVPRDIEDPRAVAEKLAPELLAFRERQQQRVRQIIERTGQRERDEDTDAQSEPENSEDEDNEENTPDEDAEESSETQDSSNETAEDEETREERLERTEEELYKKFNQKSDPYEPIIRSYVTLDEQFRTFLQQEQIPGIVLEKREVRTYPEEDLAAHTLGYVGFQGNTRVGRYGIEGYFDDLLKGDPGWLSGEQDTEGQFIGVGANQFKPPEDGSDIVLTIDRVVQSMTEEVLKRGVERFDAERGSIVVMETDTGAIRGMATYPAFDPNTYYAVSDPRVQINPVVSDIFEPGSILKPAVMAAAIEEDIVEPDTTFVDDGPVEVGKYTIDTYDGEHHGRQTMTQVLEKSNNVGMVWVAQQMGIEMLYDYLRRFGVGERTGIRLEGETQTNLAPPDEWSQARLATASFGQGIALTPLQAINAINTIGNDGKLMQPYIVEEVRKPDGTVRQTQPDAVRKVVSSATASDVSAMMVSVIENGVAGLAKVPGYFMAGKTGTAQVSGPKGQYSDEDKIISFVGFGPVEDPQFTVLVKLDNPAGLSFSSGTAAPMFSQISQKLLNYYQVPPSYDDSEAAPVYDVTGNN